ncbi:Uu.00g027810.m01.CDS01 [Anthostomella pinea]|uniref:Uu.00g027810.m01.CDS01 n=1 Tax=Anthostomella pinea TaxID=933095 RepID=A0AAI8V2Z4_9PEZI|nr:Uu.00g027810.m01.CDS01 [Anthostomella pinea]
MRLLKVEGDGSLGLHKDLIDDFPPYAILSHTWGADDQEVTFKDLVDNTGREKAGYKKIEFCARQAVSDNLQFFWVDTCCIDKANYTELSEAINSMFRWYERAARCYVYLSDVSDGGLPGSASNPNNWEASFRGSRWLTRGWTLQELIAPSSVEFFSKEGHRLGDKSSLESLLCDITGIPAAVLRGTPLSQSSIQDRMSWSDRRTTKREEDGAYSLLGIFGVNMPLIYGEGKESAFTRLREVIDKRSKAGRAHSPSSERSFSDDEKRCIQQLGKFDISDYKRLLPKPAHGTCQWVLRHPSFVLWLSKAGNALLWLTGHAGCGKTVLTSFLAQYFEQTRSLQISSPNVLVYFCDDKINKQKDANAILIGLIFQILQRHRSMIRYVRRMFELLGSSMIQSFSALWGIFQKITQDPAYGHLYVFVDALDECDSDSCRQLLDAIGALVAHPLHSTESPNQIKFLLSGRPLISLSSVGVPQVVAQRISVDEHQPGYSEDLRLYIYQRVNEISTKLNCSHQVKDYLLQTLQTKSDQTFLWVHMVLTSLEGSLLASMKDFRDIINQIPRDLESAYSRLLSAIPSEYQHTASLLLKLVLASSRPLDLDEINLAFSINSLHSCTDDVKTDCQPDILRTVQGVLGPMARISDSKVSLVHQSAKDFLQGAERDYGSFSFQSSLDVGSCALHMSAACIHYLMLDDFMEEFSDHTLFTDESSGASHTTYSGSLSSSPDPFLSENLRILSEDFGLNLSSDSLPTVQEANLLGTELCEAVMSRYKLYSYAALHWTEHYAICESSASDELIIKAESLLDASFENCRNWVRYYSSKVASADDDDIMDFEPIMLAAYFNLQKTVVRMLQSDTISAVAKDRSLFWAARAGHGRVASDLLHAGADPNLHHSSRQTPITVAAENGHVGCVTMLLADVRTDTMMAGRSGRSALSFACGNGHDEMVEKLLRRDQRLAIQQDHYGYTPLYWAVGGGYMSITSKLLRQPGIVVNHRDHKGRTIVSHAAGDGMEEALSRLLKVRGVDPNLADDKGKSPLSWAAGNGHAAAVAVLTRSKKVDKSSQDHDRRNAISWASAGGHVDALRKLIQARCPGIDAQDVDGWAPLAWAIHNDSSALVQTLLSTGLVDLERRDHSGRTALSWAVEYGHASVVRCLLEAGADANTVSDTDETPIQVAVDYGRDDLRGELLRYIR